MHKKNAACVENRILDLKVCLNSDILPISFTVMYEYRGNKSNATPGKNWSILAKIHVSYATSVMQDFPSLDIATFALLRIYRKFERARVCGSYGDSN